MSKFDRLKENTDFIQDVNSDVKQTQTITTKNKSSLELEPNKLSHKERSRSKHGRNLTTYLFVEELDIIEQAVAKLSDQTDTSMSGFVRQAILEKARSILGEEEYNHINDNKRNVIKIK